MTPPIYDQQGKRKKTSQFGLVRIAEHYKKDVACFYCNSIEKLHIEHVRALQFGGNDTINNLQILCEMCHRQKSTDELNPKTRTELITNHSFLIPRKETTKKGLWEI